MTWFLPLAFFFVSGFSGLLYQMVWLRMAFAHFGVITPVLSVVVSAFMLGLGVGSWLGGRWVERRLARSSSGWLCRYGAVELSIGLWALAVPALFQWGDQSLLGDGQMNSAVYLLRSALTLATTLLPACLCMGLTYPLMMAFWRRRDAQPESSFSALYSANVIGAVLGALCATYFFIELFGLKQTNAIGAGLNTLIGAASIGWGLHRNSQNDQPIASPSVSQTQEPSTVSDDRLLVVLAITGFSSMALEVLWTRLLTPMLGTTTYAFATVLALYLASLGAGSLLYRWSLARGRPFSPAVLSSTLIVSSMMVIPFNDPRLNLGLVGIVLSLFPFCASLGYLTPAVIDRYSQGRSGRAGSAYAANIAGCVMGPLVASYGLLPWMGVRWAILSQTVLLVSLVFCFSQRVWTRRGRGLGLWIAGGSLAIACLASESLEDRCSTGDAGVVRRDYVATVVSCGEGFHRKLLVNGVGITVLTPLTKVMAHLPLMCHAGDAHSALVICFGMGATYRSLLSWGISTTAVELVPSVPKAFGYYFDDAEAVMRNPLGRVVIDDGRRFLKRTAQRYDVITLDPPPPVEASASSLLYSPEFYALVKTRLAPNGILQQWWPGGEFRILLAVTRGLIASFPYVRVYHGLGGDGYHFLASMSPIAQPSIDEAGRKLPAEAKRDLLEWRGSNELKPALQSIFAHEVSSATVQEAAHADLLTDDRPFNEYWFLRRWAKEAKAVR